MIGTRGVPAAYGGFETAIDEVGSRLAARGHEVVVYCRGAERPRLREYAGMHLVHLPAIPSKAVETLSHTGLSVAHALAHRRPDAAFVFNAANAPFVPLLRARGIPTAVHVDGLEWRRDKWSGAGKRYYRAAEAQAVRSADALIADAAGIADYYRQQFDVPTEQIAYGATILADPLSERLAELGLTAQGYHLVVARFEPENHVALIAEGMTRSAARLPLVVVGSAPYAAAYTERVRSLADADDRIRLLGGVWDQELLDALYANTLGYVHGHSVGGTNPSLLRAMGAGAPVTAYDVGFNREVAGPAARYFSTADDLAPLLERAEADIPATVARGADLRDRAASLYDWDEVAEHYEALARRLADGQSIRPLRRGRRSAQQWADGARPEHVR
ncbi:glycosyltransferase [Mycetocola reblochoni]|uniref:Alpha-D-GlcNAc alpha-1,2-L-rhamnosyltransferase n=2 Tax=Mycetocola reblochoni TaxID=331618 RepID=A0A1R4I891_9MICO|nr:glycosyltransferase [Mycetocola reblochoni]RLP69013.1 glycosyltransferase family 1 protein [Mycetocola reblochoni]SJN16047.1 Alpha-D-GlcNAc alpha-1,2-L-rhamnosyltransferase [Mycetocola reblochoni REB411]